MAGETWFATQVMIINMLKIKQELYDYCQKYLAQRISTAQEAIKAAQASANEETKSSAGDKYETGRAMMQLEIEKNTVQLGETMKLKRMLDEIRIDFASATAQAGSLVITSQSNFFLAISVGQITIDGKIYTAVSPASPIGNMLLGLKKNASFSFNGKTYRIQEVW
jgi:transcription elongation GreA/GreB family factor